MTRIALLTTGGTIAMTTSGKGAHLGAAPPFVEMLSRTLPDVEVTLTPVLARPSAGFTPTDIAAIAQTANEAAMNYDGVVITHGTDVLEETAFALEILTRTETPIVITGAMRLANQPSADGDANLIAAVRVAAAKAARGRGVLVVFDDEIHWAPLAKKRHAFRTHAFSSEPFGPLGWVVEDRVRFTLTPDKRLPHLTWGGRETVVPILEVGPGLEPAHPALSRIHVSQQRLPLLRAGTRCRGGRLVPRAVRRRGRRLGAPAEPCEVPQPRRTPTHGGPRLDAEPGGSFPAE